MFKGPGKLEHSPAYLALEEKKKCFAVRNSWPMFVTHSCTVIARSRLGVEVIGVWAHASEAQLQRHSELTCVGAVSRVSIGRD